MVPFHNHFVPIPPNPAMLSVFPQPLRNVDAQGELFRDARRCCQPAKPLLHVGWHQVTFSITMMTIAMKITMTMIRYRKHEVTIELVSKQEKTKLLKVIMGFKLTMGDFISTSYLVNLIVDPLTTSLRLEGAKEARKVLGEHLERMVEKSHRILADRGELDMVPPPVLNTENKVERPASKGVAKKKKGGNGSKAADEKRIGDLATKTAPPPASLPECPVCLQEMKPGDKIFQVFGFMVWH